MNNRRTLGVRRSAVLAAVGMIALALMSGALILRSQLRDSLERAIGERTLTRAEGVASVVATGDLRKLIDPDDRGASWVQVVSAQKVLASTANAANLNEPMVRGVLTKKREVRRLLGVLVDPSDRMAVAFVPVSVNGRPFTVIAASPLDLADANDRRVISILGLVFSLLLVISAAVLWVVLRRALHPIETMRAEVSAITSSDLSRRVDVPNSNDEIANLASTMNDMLARLETATKQQQAFVADASHELRSPLASLRTQLEASVYEAHSAEWSATVNDMLVDHDRLERLVADLLLLANRDGGVPLIREPVDLGYLVRTETSRRALRPGIELRVEAANVLVKANADALARILRNLLDNAERHASSVIEVQVRQIDHAAELSVHDDGPGVPQEFRHAVFERFRRLDAARTGESGGSGLGLAIVADLVSAHDGTVKIEPSTVGARVVIRIPVLSV